MYKQATAWLCFCVHVISNLIVLDFCIMALLTILNAVVACSCNLLETWIDTTGTVAGSETMQ